MVEGRTQEGAKALWETLSTEQRRQVEAVAVDMWEPYLKATKAKAPQAELVHDNSRISRFRLHSSLVIRHSDFSPGWGLAEGALVGGLDGGGSSGNRVRSC